MGRLELEEVALTTTLRDLLQAVPGGAPKICATKMQTFRGWGLPLTEPGVWAVAPSRARSVVDGWAQRQWPELGRRARRARVAAQGLPLGRTWATLARGDRIPTLMSSYDQHVCLIGRGFNRVMSVAEVLAALKWPAEDAMAEVLTKAAAEPRQHRKVLQHLGLSVNVEVTRRVLERGIRRAGLWDVEELRCGTTFSGVDGVAAAGRRLHPGWRHVFAAETDVDRAGLLRESGTCEQVYGDATAAEVVEAAPPVDVWTATFECGPNSGMDRTEGAESSARREDNLLALDRALQYVQLYSVQYSTPHTTHSCQRCTCSLYGTLYPFFSVLVKAAPRRLFGLHLACPAVKL